VVGVIPDGSVNGGAPEPNQWVQTLMPRGWRPPLHRCRHELQKVVKCCLSSQRGLHHVALPLSTRRLTVDEETRAKFDRDGFVKIDCLLPPSTVEALLSRYDALFAGDFPTGCYPDEWHWREGISKPDAFREIVNAWKCDPVVASVVLSADIGRATSEMMGWAGARVGQDDILWKPPGGSEVAFHTDAAYISDQFCPRDNNSVTVWIALDDADEETGVVEYAPGSHRWPRASATGAAVESTFHASDDYLSALREAAQLAGVEPCPAPVRLPVPSGSVVFHHQDVWHGSARNSSATRPRRALGVHMVRYDVEWRASPPPDYIYGRYKRPGDRYPDETAFPITYRDDGRTTTPLFEPLVACLDSDGASDLCK